MLRVCFFCGSKVSESDPKCWSCDSVLGPTTRIQKRTPFQTHWNEIIVFDHPTEAFIRVKTTFPLIGQIKKLDEFNRVLSGTVASRFKPVEMEVTAVEEDFERTRVIFKPVMDPLNFWTSIISVRRIVRAMIALP